MKITAFVCIFIFCISQLILSAAVPTDQTVNTDPGNLEVDALAPGPVDLHFFDVGGPGENKVASRTIIFVAPP
ncbi:hypothetical protein EVG20_g10361 [Dentipellis fragilis]|uniref:Uncharacterized protein n=1 Tax=Dentipellis fragilis TaxID=205917 RepID=A0A4Y9XSZ1_9AGAM|nr:hypothetical protein EVG20_g10361 [Dentipellis fragilis]